MLTRFDYLELHDGPVIEGLERFEKVYAKDQPDYKALRTLAGEDGLSALYRVHLTSDQREMVAQGADVLVEIIHFRGPLAPSRVMLLNQEGLDEGGRADLAKWMAAQTKGPYRRVM